MPTPEDGVVYTFVGALFHGLYLTTLFHCLRWLVFTNEGWKLREKIGWTNVTISLIICVLSTIAKALELRNTMVQVVRATVPKPPPPPSGFVGSTISLPWMAVVICTNVNLTTLLVDAVLIYRCWIIYHRKRWVIVFPSFLWLGGLMLTALQAYWQIVQSASILKAWQPINMTIGPGTVLTPFWGSTILLNGYSTIMIARRLDCISDDCKAITSVDRLKFLMRVIIESGFLYLATAIAHFVVWWTPNTYAIAIISRINLSATGIAFNLILIRVAQRRAEEEDPAKHPVISSLRFNHTDFKSVIGQSVDTDELRQTDAPIVTESDVVAV